MADFLGELIFDARRKQGLTQEEYAFKYKVTGPAIFKIEKGYVKPSLELWLQMAKDAGLSPRRAVLLLVKARLPVPFQEFIEVQDAGAGDAEAKKAAKKGAKPDYSKFENPEQMREILKQDKTLPKELKELLGDDMVWAVFKPTGHEINTLRDVFGTLGKGTKQAYREALHLIREFAHSF